MKKMGTDSWLGWNGDWATRLVKSLAFQTAFHSTLFFILSRLDIPHKGEL
jgi:hypothetical protein